MFIFFKFHSGIEPLFFPLFPHKNTYFDHFDLFGDTPLPNIHPRQAPLTLVLPFLVRVLYRRVVCSTGFNTFTKQHLTLEHKTGLKKGIISQKQLFLIHLRNTPFYGEKHSFIKIGPIALLLPMKM